MVVAGGIKVGLGGKPKDLIDLVGLLVAGAPESQGEEGAADSEYIEEQWWPQDDKPVRDAPDGRRGDDP